MLLFSKEYQLVEESDTICKNHYEFYCILFIFVINCDTLQWFHEWKLHSVHDNDDIDEELNICGHVVRELEMMKKENEVLKMHFQVWSHRWEKLEGTFNIFGMMLTNIEKRLTSPSSVDVVEEIKKIITNIPSKECDQQNILPEMISLKIVNENQVLLADIDKKLEPLTQVKELLITANERILRFEENFLMFGDFSANFQQNILPAIYKMIDNKNHAVIEELTNQLKSLSQLKEILVTVNDKIYRFEERFMKFHDFNEKFQQELLPEIKTIINSKDDSIIVEFTNQLEPLSKVKELLVTTSEGILRCENNWTNFDEFNEKFQDDILPEISAMIDSKHRGIILMLDKQLEPLSQVKELLVTTSEGILRCENNCMNFDEFNEKFQEDILPEISAMIDRKHHGLTKVFDKQIAHFINLQDVVTKQYQGISSIEKNLTIVADLSKKLSDQILSISYVKENHDLLTGMSTRLAKIEHNISEIIDYDLYPLNCMEYNAQFCNDTVCRIKHPKGIRESLFVSCVNHTIYGDGWLVIQRRMDGSVDFFRNWIDYKTGFGNISGEFWIGLEHLHELTTLHGRQELVIILEDFENVTKHVKYDSFVVGNENEKYLLKDVGEYTGDAGVAFARHSGYKFSTIDNDNDIDDDNCARTRMGGWWYLNCFWCNLNGVYYSTGHGPDKALHSGISWLGFHDYDYSMKFVQMMIRPHKNTTKNKSI
uniref:Fibrinogen C-terminal domain-containing protein n=1 Tax=Glossina brevipalpis TaxID=37001 RepID=A0A1A9WG82_9MUSC